jgi:hypothetical protein
LLQLALRGGKFGPFLVQFGLKIPWIDLQQHLALFDLLIVSHEQLRHPPRHLGRNGGYVCPQECVVGGFIGSDAPVIVRAASDTGRQHG